VLTEELLQDDPHSYSSSRKVLEISFVPGPRPERYSPRDGVQRLTSQDLGKEEQLGRLVQRTRSLAVIRILEASDLGGLARLGALGRPWARGSGECGILGTRGLDRSGLDTCWRGGRLGESEEGGRVE